MTYFEKGTLNQATIDCSCPPSNSYGFENKIIRYHKHADTIVINEIEQRKDKDELIEKVAGFMHDQWSHWMKYQFSQTLSTHVVSGEKGVGEIIKPSQVKHWTRQMNAPYAKLSEKEKDFDREWARKLLEVIK